MHNVPEFLEIDLSRMLENPKCAVHIATKEDAPLVLFNARRQFKDFVIGSWPEDGYWSNYQENTAYTLFYRNSDEPQRLSYGSLPWFRENGYEILEINDLLASPIDIEESDLPVDELFGVMV